MAKHRICRDSKHSSSHFRFLSIDQSNKMCSTSKVNEAMAGMTKTSSNQGVFSIAAPRVQQNRSEYFLVDIREAAEIQAQALPQAADAAVPMGAICHDASGLVAQNKENKTIVLACPTGQRAEVAAQSIALQSPTTKVAFLQRGIVGLQNPSAVTPEFLVVLGLGDSTEKLSLSLAALAAATDSYQTVVMVLMSDGVNWFLKPDSPKAASAGTANVESVVQGDPFKPCKAMLKKFLTNGGIVLACASCVKHRGYSYDDDLMDCVKPLQMPDLVRMLGEAKGGSMQFL